jgi:sortase A
MVVTRKQILERLLLCSALLLLAIFGVAELQQFYASRAELAKFEARLHEVNADLLANHRAASQREKVAESSANSTLWSATRAEGYLASLSRSVEPVAILKIAKIGLTVPVLEGTSAFTLNRGVGHIPGTAGPGQEGNIGIAGHRDSFFRGLKDLREGDSLQLVTKAGTESYIVRRIRITDPHDVSVLQPTASRTLTLVTCYPFYYVGPAPQRFIVEASLRQ